MCLSYAWRYRCGCVAPKPTNNPIHRCTTWEFRRSCEPKEIFSYLDVDCSELCRWSATKSNDRYRPRQDDWYLYSGPYQDEPSEEDYYFNRVSKQLIEPFFMRSSRRRRARAVRQRSSSSADNQEIVTRGHGNDDYRPVEGEDSELIDLDLDIEIDESKPEEHASKGDFGGRFTRRRK